ncbi:MAG TPA: hypothetical protein VJT69_17965 [Pyrinomonadaceae bacterium]|nr:hypothetical protein [Pyrinomonadaceae bacterium]
MRAQVTSNDTEAPPKVTGVSGELRIGRTIVVEVQNLSTWATKHETQNLVPYLNGQPLRGVYPEITDLTKNNLQFNLAHTQADLPVWSALFHHPGLRRPVEFSVGVEDQEPFQTVYNYDHPLSLTVVPRRLGIIALSAMLAVFIIVIGLMITTNIIRAPGAKLPQGKRPYELGRFLTLFWTAIIATCYFAVWLITGDSNLPATALALTGFSSIVALTGYLTRTGPDETSDDSTAIVPGAAASANFLTDVLSDTNGYSFHRFQLLMWNILLGVMFVSLVWENLTLPAFSQSLIALMGISASVHLSFEFLDRYGATGGIAADPGHM